MAMERAEFTIGDSPLAGPFAGYTKGEDWNGWEVPYFTREVGLEIVSAWRKGNPGHAAIYAPTADAFLFEVTDAVNQTDEYAGMDTDAGHLYAIGERYWCWERED